MIPIPQDYRAVLALGALGLLAYFIIRSDIGKALGKVGEGLNPTSDRNIFYRGTNAIGGAVTGKRDFSLGSWLYDVFNKPYDPNAANTPRLRQAAARLSPVQPIDKPTVYLYR